MAELVLTVPVASLKALGIEPVGLVDAPLHSLNQHAFGFGIREWLDSKTEETVEHGKSNLQVTGYIVVRALGGGILAYQRKGKEKGLHGKWSIGLGGHIDVDDLLEGENTLSKIVSRGTYRELSEELGRKDIVYLGEIKFNQLLYTQVDATSSVHLGAVAQLVTVDKDSLNPNPSELLNYEWLSQDQLKSDDREWETWSKLLIEDMQ